MEAEFVEGDIIIVNPHVETKPGDFVVVKNDDNGEATFKHLRKYGETIFSILSIQSMRILSLRRGQSDCGEGGYTC